MANKSGSLSELESFLREVLYEGNSKSDYVEVQRIVDLVMKQRTPLYNLYGRKAIEQNISALFRVRIANRVMGGKNTMCAIGLKMKSSVY